MQREREREKKKNPYEEHKAKQTAISEMTQSFPVTDTSNHSSKIYKNHDLKGQYLPSETDTYFLSVLYHDAVEYGIFIYLFIYFAFCVKWEINAGLFLRYNTECIRCDS